MDKYTFMKVSAIDTVVYGIAVDHSSFRWDGNLLKRIKKYTSDTGIKVKDFVSQ